MIDLLVREEDVVRLRLYRSYIAPSRWNYGPAILERVLVDNVANFRGEIFETEWLWFVGNGACVIYGR
jgi:hypothetical protein